MNDQINRIFVRPEELKDQPVITTLDQLFCMELIDLQLNREELLKSYYNRTLFLGKSPEEPMTVVYGTGAAPYFNIRRWRHLWENGKISTLLSQSTTMRWA